MVGIVMALGGERRTDCVVDEMHLYGDFVSQNVHTRFIGMDHWSLISYLCIQNWIRMLELQDVVASNSNLDVDVAWFMVRRVDVLHLFVV